MHANEDLVRLLQPQAGGTAGPEQAQAFPHGVICYADALGSHRFVVHDRAGTPLAALQVMYRAGDPGGLVANAYTRPEVRRRGCFRHLCSVAENCFGALTFSADRSELGQLAAAHIEQCGVGSVTEGTAYGPQGEQAEAV